MTNGAERKDAWTTCKQLARGKISVGLSCHFADETGLDSNSYEEQNLACDDTQREFPAWRNY